MLAMTSFMLSRDDVHRIDKLLGRALVDDCIYRRLLYERDEQLFAEFEITYRAQSWLRDLPATSLYELARAVTPSFAHD